MMDDAEVIPFGRRLRVGGAPRHEICERINRMALVLKIAVIALKILMGYLPAPRQMP
jgi:hypothetical protein